MSYLYNCIDALDEQLGLIDEQIKRLNAERSCISESRNNLINNLDNLDKDKNASSGKYTNLTNKDAIIEFLREQNRPCTITEITNALERGGIKSKAGRFYSNVNAILIDKDNINIFKKENKLWSLK